MSKFGALKRVLRDSPEIPLALGLGAGGVALGSQTLDDYGLLQPEKIDDYATAQGVMGSGLGLIASSMGMDNLAKKYNIPLRSLPVGKRALANLLFGSTGGVLGGTAGKIFGEIVAED